MQSGQSDSIKKINKVDNKWYATTRRCS